MTVIADSTDQARLSAVRTVLQSLQPSRLLPSLAAIDRIQADGFDYEIVPFSGDTIQLTLNEDGQEKVVLTLTSTDVTVAVTDTGYEFSGGFADRAVGQAGANDLGSNVQYTQAMAADNQWLRFGFSSAAQATNDIEYWGETNPNFDQTKGLFGGLHMPAGITDLFDFDDTSLSAEVTGGSLNYTAANGSYDLTQCNVGDLVKIRFSFNAIPQGANSTLEVGLIFATRDENDAVTFTFPLTTQPVYYGTGTQGDVYLNRVEMSAYLASNEDVNARLLPAVRCDNEILIQPLSTLISIIR